MSDKKQARPVRKVYVLREVECSMTDLKKNDLFRISKATPDDPVNPGEWFIAESDAEPVEATGEFNINATPMAFIRNEMYRVGSRFAFVPESIVKMIKPTKKGSKK